MCTVTESKCENMSPETRDVLLVYMAPEIPPCVNVYPRFIEDGWMLSISPPNVAARSYERATSLVNNYTNQSSLSREKEEHFLNLRAGNVDGYGYALREIL